MSAKQQGTKSHVLNSKPDTLAKLLKQLGGNAMVLTAKESKRGKPMLSGNGTVQLKCGGEIYKFSVSLNATAIDSDKSPLPEGAREAIMSAGQLTLKDLGLGDRIADPREFTSGKVGFYFGDKVVPTIGGVSVKCQVGCSIVAWHSDTWQADEPASEASDKDQAPAG